MNEKEKVIELLQMVVAELEDSISFMETFDKEYLGDENRLQDKYDALEKVGDFFEKHNKQ